MYEAEDDASGSFAFTTERDGVYRFCFFNTRNSNGESPETRVELNVDVGSASAGFTPLEQSVRSISDKLSAIQMEQRNIRQREKRHIYMRQREKRHKRLTDKTSRKVLMWSFLETLVLVGAGLAQVFFIKLYFNKAG
ncbi:LOW QUALITY PROTEIN: TMP21-related protein [Kipferlia bialata]|uniref:TMP21-related protein n=1 Tax=Kipferlia bialata TaxID=797122 RepID=A0A9K3D2Q1_9EUKA|nr:LOW QUALITY PROTEIN: TMP21-related protein [Kipferlia bialata]